MEKNFDTDDYARIQHKKSRFIPAAQKKNHFEHTLKSANQLPSIDPNYPS